MLGSRTALLHDSNVGQRHSRQATLFLIFCVSFICSFMFLLGWNSEYAVELVNSHIGFFTHSRSEVSLPNRPQTYPSLASTAYSPTADGSATLGIASNLYVISLRRRADRRSDMEKLRRGMGLRWTYVDALEKTDERVENILAHVQRVRTESINGTYTGSLFEWGRIIDSDQTALTEVARRSEVYMWPDRRPNIQVEPLLTNRNATVICATEDATVPVYTDDSLVPPHMRLSRGMVACWYSHMSLLRRLVENQFHRNTLPATSRRISRHSNKLRKSDADRSISGSANGAVIIFEDDIDMEWDLRERLVRMWPDLPDDWDIVFLGHCWSPTPLPPLTPTSPLHPALAPKCTHAYALSQKGIIRLLAHLSHPHFAYSRALDQAIAWLVKSGRLKAFSVVPSVVVQRKLGASDVWEGTIEGKERNKGSAWKETLVDSAFGRIEKMDMRSTLSTL